MATRKHDPNLVVIQLSGGNDYLNTIVPFNSGEYYDYRPTVNIEGDSVLPIDDDHGFNPNMAPIKDLYDQGKVAVINGIGYPNPNRSHFRSMDIWHTAEPNDIATEGWLGRATRDIDPTGENVLTAVNFGRGLPRALGVRGVPVASVGNLETYGLFPDLKDEMLRKYALDAFAKMYGGERGRDAVMDFLGQTGTDALKGADLLRTALDKYSSNVEYAANPIAQGLNDAAKVMFADLGTRIFYTQQGSYDTHSGELATHASLIGDVSTARRGLLRRPQGARPRGRHPHPHLLRVRKAYQRQRLRHRPRLRRRSLRNRRTGRGRHVRRVPVHQGGGPARGATSTSTTTSGPHTRPSSTGGSTSTPLPSSTVSSSSTASSPTAETAEARRQHRTEGASTDDQPRHRADGTPDEASGLRCLPARARPPRRKGLRERRRGPTPPGRRTEPPRRHHQALPRRPARATADGLRGRVLGLPNGLHPVPLEEKLTLFWHGLFATGYSKLNQARTHLNQIDMFRRFGLGSFRDILVELSKDPAMIIWLDNQDNHDGAVNENYGRELLELFSMGIGSYSEQDVKECARAFTGWTLKNAEYMAQRAMKDSIWPYDASHGTSNTVTTTTTTVPRHSSAKRATSAASRSSTSSSGRSPPPGSSPRASSSSSPPTRSTTMPRTPSER